MADAFNTTTSHAEFIPERWDEAAILAATDHTMNGCIAVAARDPRPDQPGMGGAGDVFHYGIQSAVTLAAVTEGTALERKQFSASEKTLTIGTQRGVVVLATDKLRAQSRQQHLEWMFQQAGFNAGVNLDTALGALYASAGETVTGTTTAYITEAQIRSAKLKLDNAKARRQGRWLVVDPNNMDAITGISAFRTVDSIANGTDAITEGMVGRIHGFDLFMSHNLTAASGKRHCLAGVRGDYRSSSLVYGIGQLQPNMAGQPERIVAPIGVKVVFNYNSLLLGDEAAIQQLYGVAAVRSEWLVDIETAD